MNYPVWDTPLVGGGLLVALMATLHVFIVQITVGGAILLALGESAFRGDVQWRGWLQCQGRALAALSVIGAVTGAGAAVAIQLSSPAASSTLARAFFWAWAIAWAFYVVQTAALLLYAHAPERGGGARRPLLAACGALAAWCSLAAVNGILTFMLTPGRWPADGSLLRAWLNPGAMPSLVLRTGMALGLGGLSALLSLSREGEAPYRLVAIRRTGLWVLGGFLIAAAAAPWYLARMPAAARTLMDGRWPALTSWLHAAWMLTAAIVLVAAAAACLRPRWMRPGLAALLLLMAFTVLGAFETIRERARKPYLVQGYLYANGLRAGELEEARRLGLPACARWADPAAAADPRVRGREVFRFACAGCHTFHGFRGLVARLVAYDAPRLRALLRGPERLRYGMPPFPGNDADAEALTHHLTRWIPPAASAATGAAVFRRRCFACHDLRGSFHPLTEHLAGVSAGEAAEILDSLGHDGANSMPPFGGTAEEKALLAAWLAAELAAEPGGGE